MSFLWTTQNHRARRTNRRPNLEFKSHDFMFCAVISFLYALICWSIHLISPAGSDFDATIPSPLAISASVTWIDFYNFIINGRIRNLNNFSKAFQQGLLMVLYYFIISYQKSYNEQRLNEFLQSSHRSSHHM